MSWWFERLIKNFAETSVSENSGKHANCSVTAENEKGEEVVVAFAEESPSIFSQIYEVNGCYKCALRTSGPGFGSYKCDVIFMEKQLIVLHLVSRDNLNVSRILAPNAATAFAASVNTGSSEVSRGEWIVLPFDHITMIELQNQGNEANIVTKAGISYVLGDNEECVLKAYGIFNERRVVVAEREAVQGREPGGSPAHSFSLYNANTPLSSRIDIGEASLSMRAPLANIFPGCIVSVTAVELAKILTSSFFYSKYVLDPKETFELVIGKWGGNEDPGGCKHDSEFCLKQGASRDIKYRRKISTGVLDIWVSFTEKHQISFPTDRSFIHISIDVKFSIFETEIGIKILIRMVEIQQEKTQFDLECELENTGSLPYLVRYQLENSTISSIKQTVEKYITGIRDHFSELSHSHDAADFATELCSRTSVCNATYPEYPLNLFKQHTTKCNESMICCLHPLTQVLKSILMYKFN